MSGIVLYLDDEEMLIIDRLRGKKSRQEYVQEVFDFSFKTATDRIKKEITSDQFQRWITSGQVPQDPPG